MSYRLHILVIATFFIITANAQYQNRQVFTFAQGLSTYNIKKTIQDKYGFLWIATQDGVFRFDGTVFQPIKKNSNTEGSIRENFILDITPGINADLFVSSFNGGIDKVNIRTLSVVPYLSLAEGQNTGIPNLAATRLLCDRRGNLWTGGEDFLGLVSANEKKYRALDLPRGLQFKGTYVTFFRELNDSTIAVGINEIGILFYNSQSFRLNGMLELDAAPRVGQLPNNGLVQVNDTVLYFSAGPYLVKGSYRNGKWQTAKKALLNTPGQQTINCLVKDAGNRILIGTINGFYIFDPLTGTISDPGDSGENPDKQYINDLFFDNQDGLWLSTSKHLERISLLPSPFRAYTGKKDRKTRMNHVYSMASRNKEEILACGIDGLYECRLRDGQIRKIRGTGSLGIIHYVLKMNEDHWLISAAYGMYLYLPGKEIVSKTLLLQYYPEWKPFAGHYFNNSVEVNGKIYWASEEQEGLLIWEPASKKIKQYKAGTPQSGGIPENHMHNIKLDRKGNIWMLFDNSVARLDPENDTVTKILRYMRGKPGFNAGIFFDMYDDGEKLWFGTYGGGLNGYDPDREEWCYITEKEGLCNNAVYGILEENDSVFWVSTNNGISRVQYRSRRCRNFYKNDGLQDNSFDEKGALRLDNKLLFAGVNGFSLVDPSLYFDHTRPYPTYIKRLEYRTGTSLITLNELDWEKLKLPAGTSAVTVWLSALNYSGGRPDFGYKIKGYHDDYIPAGKENKIELNALSYGEYEIEISYRNESGELTNSALRINIEILPHWYQTSWFRLFVLLAALAFTAFLVRWVYSSRLKRQRMLLEKQLAIQEERQRIATEMHDDIGAGLSGIKLMTETAVNRISDATAINEIKKIYRSVGEIASRMKEVIWSLNTKNDRLENLLNYLQKQVRIWLENYPCRLKIQIPESIPDMELTGEIRRNIYLSVKEAVHNIIKHSDANEVRFSVSCDDILRISISDNGKGIPENEDNGGNGLKNMRARMEKINGRLSVFNQQGTALVFDIPIKAIK